MKIKIILVLLGSMQIALHESFCISSSFSSSKQAFFYCSSCGSQVSAKEVLVMHGNLKKILCKKCYAFLRGKESEGVQDQPSEVSLPASITVEVCDVATQISDDDEADHFYENPEIRRIIDEESWSVSVGDGKKPQKIRVGKNRKKLLIRKKPKQKTTIFSPLHSAAAAALSALSSIPLGMWMYSFPQRSEIQPNSELQVIHDDQLFVCRSDRPARELWCKGPRAVVVTDDGYTYFDIVNDKRLFFSRKQDLEAYVTDQGFACEFKVVLQDPHSLYSEKKSTSVDDVFEKYDQGMQKAFDHYETEMKRIDQEGEEKYQAKIREITKKVPEITFTEGD